MTAQDKCPWLPAVAATRIDEITQVTSPLGSEAIAARIEALAEANRTIHEKDCFNLNPATNVMNPRAEALLASGMGSRPRSATRVTNMRWASKPSRKSR